MATTSIKPPESQDETTKRMPTPPGDQGFWLSNRRRRLATLNEQMEAAYSHNPWVYAATQAIAIPISEVPFRIMRETATRRTGAERRDALKKWIPKASEMQIEAIAGIENPRDRVMRLRRTAPWLPPHLICQAATGVEPIEQGEWFELFTKVNPEITRAQLWEATLIYMNATEEGECFWELVGRDGKVEPREVPREIWPRGGTNFKAVFDEQATRVIGWILDERFSNVSLKTGQAGTVLVKERFDVDQIVHFKHFDPRNAVRGFSPLRPIRELVEMYFRAVRFNTKFFQNGGALGGVFQWKGGENGRARINQDEIEDFLEKWTQRFSGENLAHQWAGLAGDVELKEIGTSQRDMQFLQMLKQIRDDIMAVYRVSKSALGLVEDQNRANLLASMRGLWETTLLPKVQYMEDLLASNLFTPERTQRQQVFGMFDLSEVEALQENFSEKLEHAKSLTDIGYPVNDVNDRLELGMEPKPWGDRWYAPINLVPVGGDGEGGSPTPDEPEEPEQEQFRAPARPLSRFHKDEMWQRAVDRVMDPAEKRYRREYKAFLTGVRRAQLRKLGEREIARVTVPEQLLFPLGEHQRRVAARMEPVYRSTFDQAAADATFEAAAQRGISADWRQLPGDKEDFIRSMTEEVKRTVVTMRESLRKLVATALLNDATEDELEQAIKDFFNQFAGGGKVGVIARTEVSTTVNAARFMTFEGLEVDVHEWVTAGDELVRNTHVTYGSGGVRPMGFNWAELSGGDYTLLYPLDPQSPLIERVNCRCVSVPV